MKFLQPKIRTSPSARTLISSLRSKFEQFIKAHQADIILVVGVILISLLSFAIGYIIAESRGKEPLKIEQHESSKNSHCWSRDNRPLSSLEAFGEWS